MMEEPGLVVVILIVTVSDEKCSSCSCILTSQFCNTFTGSVLFESVIKKKKVKAGEEKCMCRHMRGQAKWKRERQKGIKKTAELRKSIKQNRREK